jgi:CRP-like cAMP-binding protein
VSSPAFKSCALLADLTDTERAAVSEHLDVQDLEEGDLLFVEGQEADGLFVVERGSLAVASSRAGEIGVLGEGAALGALSLVAVGPREVTARAAAPTRVLYLTRFAFGRLLEDAPRAACRLLERVVADVATDVRAELDRLASAEIA